jgi:hypothetical protein
MVTSWVWMVFVTSKGIGARPVAGKELSNASLRARAMEELGESHEW